MADFAVAGGHRVEVAWVGPPRDESGRAIVFLHEGLGSVSAWRDFPRSVADAAGLSGLVYSRWGYGASDPVTPPRPLTYMHEEGERTLGELLDACGVREATLIGHSDGGSIAIVHAGSRGAGPDAGRVRGLALLAPHVFCEDVSVRSIEAARDAYRTGDLRARLARHHHDVDGAFWGWNRAWLDPGFRAWNIEGYLAGVDAPVLAIQGEDDPYGTLAQIDAIERGLHGPFARLVLPGCGHAPHRDRPEETRAALVDFVARTLRPAC